MKLYHSTHGASLAQIQREGLKPRVGPYSPIAGVFMWQILDQAIWWATTVGNDILLTIDLPTELFLSPQLVRDDGIFKGGISWIFSDTIPPRLIVEVTHVELEIG